MKRYALLYAALLGAMLLLFVVAEALQLPVLTDAEPLRGRTGAAAALVGVLLLVADVVLPVPSSVVMVAHGALFGPVAGTLFSFAGSVGAFAVGFGLGRRGGAVVGRFVAADDRRRADRVLARWGTVAIILSRPLPMVAETLSFVAGGSSLRWPRALAAAAVGSLPAAVLYAVTGAVAAGLASGAVVFVVVVVLAAGAAMVAARAGGKALPRSSPNG